MEPMKATSVNSRAEELFVQLFCEAFGPEKTENLQVQYPCVDIYGRHRYIDFALESPESKIAIEIDGETYHNPSKVSENKYADDLLKQNSLIYDNWKVYRWIYSQLEKQPEKVKDELITFLGTSPMFKAFEADLPVQMGQTIELRDYQQEATENLQKMREDGKTIALLYHATGVGKTITAATDAKAVGGRTLFLVNALKLASQAKETFAKVWPEATLGEYTGSQKDMTQTVIFATVQSISKDLEKFSPTDFDYLIVDECHHAAANTYQKIFTYFHPKFILGLTATPERSDGEDMLELFQNVAHKMDLKTAVERGVLVPIRCIRVKTNIDLTDVRINGIKYNSQDLESKLFIPERNQLIVDTYLKYVNGKKTVIFCASVDHAAEIAKYQPMAYVLAPENKRKLDQDMLFQGEKPEAWLDVPIDMSDYEIIDLFNWQNSVKDMISQIEFVRMVDVQSETVERYIKDGKVKPDLSIPFGDKRMFHYFREESIRNIAKQYGWDLITPQNMADKFMKFIETMDMSYSYKPVLLKAIYEYMDTSGRVALPDMVDYFIDFYEDRKVHGMIAEKSTSIYQKGGYTRKNVEKNILSNPFKRFEDMRFLMRCKDVETIEVNPIIFRKLTREDWLHIVDVCDKSLEKYYLRLKK
ncbi:DEAD/DEAH box helicase family protein [Faecalibacterium prausnitzii]|uniref:DEAD/DEAH box helicase n=2 Tax=Faecalibacterium prausnitzii TaxID=853 RepID=UPI001C262942|nr:DEAD/DEAH box helicase family protein [Faecalibacterium prausnitzii]MBU8989009.1 DEAD/DEAH box helicase family protein [Faecalibacterium prausnitzii]MCQ5155901.1 DEAD/DEAH box helicase family protein [Faecalibacterium prausnitzii]